MFVHNSEILNSTKIETLVIVYIEIQYEQTLSRVELVKFMSETFTIIFVQSINCGHITIAIFADLEIMRLFV